MNPADAVPTWDGCSLRDDLIGLAWPNSNQRGTVFAAVGEDQVVAVPDPRLPDFLTAHPTARFVTDLDHSNLDTNVGAVNDVVVENRLYDVGLLSDLVRLAKPGVTRCLPERPANLGWADHSRCLRAEAVVLLLHAREVTDQITARANRSRDFGPLGIGLDVRGALAAACDVEGVRLIESQVPRVLAALAERGRVSRDLLRTVPEAKSFASTQAGAGFLDRGDLGDDPRAIGRFVRGIIREVRMQGQLPVPEPPDLLHSPSWELLAPHHRAVAAAAELRTVCYLQAELERGLILKPRVVSFPELRALAPDVGYLRRWADDSRRRLFTPVDDSHTFLIVRLPDLELRTLAACMPEVAGGLREVVRHGGAPVRLRVTQAISRLEQGEFLERMRVQAGEEETRNWDRLASAALKYLPRGVAQRTLETWLLRYETGITPSASQTRAAWAAFRELDPALPSYCECDPVAVISANMGVERDVLVGALAALAPKLRLTGEQAEIVGILGALLDGSAPKRLVEFFASDRFVSDNRLAGRPYSTLDELVHVMLARDYAAPTGRVYGQASPLQAVGRDHIELAAAVRVAVFYALTTNGFRVAAFDDEEFAVVTPGAGTDQKKRLKAKAEESVRCALNGWADDVGRSVTVADAPVW